LQIFAFNALLKDGQSAILLHSSRFLTICKSQPGFLGAAGSGKGYKISLYFHLQKEKAFN